MKLRELSFLADESIDPEVTAYLRSAGWNVQTAVEAGLLGRPDADCLRAAWQSRRTILTHDRDFGTLAIAAKEPVVGIVYLRPGHIAAPFTIASLDSLLTNDPDVESPFIIVVRRTKDEVAIRVRQL